MLVLDFGYSASGQIDCRSTQLLETQVYGLQHGLVRSQKIFSYVNFSTYLLLQLLEYNSNIPGMQLFVSQFRIAWVIWIGNDLI